MRCKAYWCHGFVDYDLDEKGELCPKCLREIIPDLDKKIAKKVQNKFDQILKDNLRLDNLECDDE